MPLQNLAVRVTLPFSDLSGVVRQWALKADRMLCYQHDEANRLHCHLLMLGVSCDVERLKQISRSVGVDGKGNTFWSFKTKSKVGGLVSEESAPRYVTYMSKGKHDPMYVKDFDIDWLLARKDEWVEPEDQLSPSQEMYLKFDDLMHDKCRNDPSICRPGMYLVAYDKVDVVKTAARFWAFGICKRVWTPYAGALSKMVFLTYCLRYDLTVSDKEKW